MAKILQLVDSLAVGGLERVAVDLANGLLVRHDSLLCATRQGGRLRQELNENVPYLSLGRRSRWDLRAVHRCIDWSRQHQAQILHAHGSSLFFANLLLLLWPRGGEDRPRLIWHDHFGRFSTEKRSRAVYRLLTARASAIISVNEQLRQWAIDELRFPPSRCIYLPNSICLERYSSLNDHRPQSLAARPAKTERPLVILCLANLRAQKNHSLLLRAFQQVIEQRPNVPLELRLVGSPAEPAIADDLHRLVESLELRGQVRFLGERSDVPELLASADIGVLSSSSEGLPLALLEYGAASLPVVSTAVGQIPHVLGLGEQQVGILVAAGSVEQLVAALLRLIDRPSDRVRLGCLLHERVKSEYSQHAALELLDGLYQQLS